MMPFNDSTQEPPGEEGHTDTESSQVLPQSLFERTAVSIRTNLHKALDFTKRTLFRRYVTVDVDGDIIRIAVVNRQTVLAWGTTSVSGNSPAQELTFDNGLLNSDSHMQRLLRSIQVQSGRSLSVLPYHSSLTRRLPMPDFGKRHLQQFAATEVLETLPFMEDEVDVAWKPYKAKKADRQLLAAAAPNRTIDEHVQHLKDAKLRPIAIYPRTLALARIAEVPNVIIVDISGSWASVILVHQGWPIVVRRIEIPGADETTEVQCTAVAEAIEEVAEHQRLTLDEEHTEPLPLLFVGQLADRQELVETLPEMMHRETVNIASPLTWPAHFPVAEYAANLGLAQAFKPRGKVLPRIPRPNLLPARHAPRRIPVLPTAIFTLLFILGYISLFAWADMGAAAYTQVSLESQADNLSRLERTRMLDNNVANGIKKDIAATASLSSKLESQIAYLDGNSKEFMAQLQAITGSALPAAGRLSALSKQGDGYALTGVLSSYEDVILYADNLRASGLFSEVHVSRVDSASGALGLPAAVFQLKAVPASQPN